MSIIKGTVHEANSVGFKKYSQELIAYYGPVGNDFEWFKKKKMRLKTKIVKKTINPVWNTDFTFEIEQPKLVAAFKVEVWDLKESLFMGQAICKNISVGTSINNNWFTLEGRKGKNDQVSGQLKISLVYAESLNKPPLRWTVVKTLIDHLEKYALETEGIYRISGLESDVQSLFSQFFDISRVPNIQADSDHHVISSALKLYLRETSEPVIPIDYQKKLLLAQGEEQDQKLIESYKETVLSLPNRNRCILTYLISHLKNVSSFSNKNKMDMNNLGTMFGPSILRVSQNEVDINVFQKQAQIIQRLLKNFDEIFGKGADMDAVAVSLTESAKEMQSVEVSEEKSQSNSNSISEEFEKKIIKKDRPKKAKLRSLRHTIDFRILQNHRLDDEEEDGKLNTPTREILANLLAKEKQQIKSMRDYLSPVPIEMVMGPNENQNTEVNKKSSGSKQTVPTSRTRRAGSMNFKEYKTPRSKDEKKNRLKRSLKDEDISEDENDVPGSLGKNGQEIKEEQVDGKKIRERLSKKRVIDSLTTKPKDFKSPLLIEKVENLEYLVEILTQSLNQANERIANLEKRAEQSEKLIALLSEKGITTKQEPSNS